MLVVVVVVAPAAVVTVVVLGVVVVQLHVEFVALAVDGGSGSSNSNCIASSGCSTTSSRSRTGVVDVLACVQVTQCFSRVTAAAVVLRSRCNHICADDTCAGSKQLWPFIQPRTLSEQDVIVIVAA